MLRERRGKTSKKKFSLNTSSNHPATRGRKSTTSQKEEEGKRLKSKKEGKRKETSNFKMKNY